MPILTEPSADLTAAFSTNAVVLFMNGTKAAPKCGQSSLVSSILGYIGIDFHHIDVLADVELSRDVVAHSGRRCIPQLYLGGTLLGGHHDFTQMVLNGELGSLLQQNGIRFDPAILDFIRAALAQKIPLARA